MSTPRLFGTNGIRGDAKKLFTNQFCFDITRAFLKFLGQKKIKPKVIVLAMDPRSSSDRIKKAVIAGIPRNWQVWDEGIIPTPALNYFTKQKKAAGIMISGSHIEEKLNGIKFFVKNEEITKKDEKIITRLYLQEKERIPYHKSRRLLKKSTQAKKMYVEMMIGLAKSNFGNFKVVVDPGNGSQTEAIPAALKKLGVKVVEINADLKEKILTRDTETEDTFPELKRRVVREKANLGIGYDADGDRAIFVDEKGAALKGEVSCSLVAKYSQEKVIVTPINTSAVVEHLGKKIIRTKVGVLYVVEMMKKHKTKVGFESNGGYISGEIFYGRDGGTLTIKMLNLLQTTGKKLSKLTAELPTYHTIKTKTDCPREINPLILAKAKERYQQYKIEDLDGLKIWFGQDTWMLFRPSGNAPEFRIFAEAKKKETVVGLVSEGMKLVKTIIKKRSR